MWVTKDVFDLCDHRRDLKKKQYNADGAKEYMEENRRIHKALKEAKGNWRGAQCEEIETCLNKNNSKREYQLVKYLISVGWLISGLTVLSDSISVYIGPSPREREKEEKR